jgi:hypothetical protein
MCLPGERLGPEWLEPHRANERTGRFARREAVRYLDQLAQPPVQDRQEDRLRGCHEESLEELQGTRALAHPDRIHEAPDRARHRLRDQGPDVLDGHGAARGCARGRRPCARRRIDRHG